MRLWPRVPAGPAVGLCVRFLLLAPVCLVLWLLILPWYVWLVAHTAQLVLATIFAAPLVDTSVKSAGLLNCATEIAFSTATGGQLTMKSVGHLVGNLAPFLALMLATPGIAVNRRLKSVGLGVAILFISHVFTLMLRYGQGRTALTTAVGFVSITLPFLLWIILAFRDIVTHPKAPVAN